MKHDELAAQIANHAKVELETVARRVARELARSLPTFDGESEADLNTLTEMLYRSGWLLLDGIAAFAIKGVVEHVHKMAEA